MPTVERDTSTRPLGGGVRVLIHLQVHSIAREGGGFGFTHGVSAPLLRCPFLHGLDSLGWWCQVRGSIALGGAQPHNYSDTGALHTQPTTADA